MVREKHWTWAILVAFLAWGCFRADGTELLEKLFGGLVVAVVLALMISLPVFLYHLITMRSFSKSLSSTFYACREFAGEVFSDS